MPVMLSGFCDPALAIRTVYSFHIKIFQFLSDLYSIFVVCLCILNMKVEKCGDGECLGCIFGVNYISASRRAT